MHDGGFALAAAIPWSHLDDLLAGEEERGNCTIYKRTYKNPTEGVPHNLNCEWVFVAPKKAHQKVQKSLI
jgi:hypothetical protein